jgi:hypothetical protein
MKKYFKFFNILTGLFLSLLIPEIVFSQAGLTNPGLTQQQEMMRGQSGSGFDTGGKSGSALGQLENIAGQRISSGSTDHHIVTPAQKTSTSNVASSISSAALFQNTVKMQIASGLANAFIGMLFSSTQKSPQQIEAERQQAALMAARAEAERRYRDSISQAKYEKMMQSYKLLNDPNGLKLKTLATGDIQFKPLNLTPAPMTMEERERQNLVKKGLKVTWDQNAWAQISNSNKMEELNTPGESGADQYLEAAIDKIETFQGGRIAALAGRYMLNIKKETMSYLKDASDAAISGNVARMDEMGKVDLRSRISSNALLKTGTQTGKAYIEQGKEYISGKIDDASDDANFALMKPAGMDLLKRGGIYSPVPDDWKVGLKTY